MTTSDYHDSAYSWYRLGATLIIAVFGNVGMWASIVVLPDIQADFATDRALASLPYTATMIGFGLGNYVVARAVDRYGVVASLIGAGALMGLGSLAAALSPTVLILSLCQLVIGFASGASFAPLIADISHWFLRRRGIAVAVTASGNYLSGAIWPLVLSGLLVESGWRAVYVALGVLIPAAVIPMAFLLRRQVPSEALAVADAAATHRAQTSGFGPRTLMILLSVAGIGCCVAMSMPQVHIVAYCVDLGYGPTVGAEMLSLMLLGGVASRLVSGLLADWLGGVRTLLIGSVLQMVALMLYLPYDGLVSLYLVSLIFGLSQGGIVPSYAIIVREYLPSRGAAGRVGLVLMITILGMALGGWMSGWIYDATGSYRLAFINGIAWNVLNIAIMLMLLIRTRPRASAVPA